MNRCDSSIQRLLRRRHQSRRDVLHAQGSVEVVLRYSELYPRTRLRGEVARYEELGSNLVVVDGRRMSAGLVVGTTGVAGVGHAQSTGWVIRGMALGSDSTPETDVDTDLGAPFVNPALSTHYHEIDSAEFPGSPSTEVTLVRTFGVSEPQAATLQVYEYGLYTAAPGPLPAATTPPGPVGGPFLVSRKTHGLITKSQDFTMEVRWTWRF